MIVLGIDIGGSGIKGALVDLKKGKLVTERHRIPTPQPSTPKAVAKTVDKLAKHFKWKGRIGCTFPAIIKNGVTLSASNVDKAWIGTDADALFEKHTGCPVTMINDADAAGLAEITYGAGKSEDGLVIMLTFGTGIGSGMFLNHRLVPNAELGHLKWDDGHKAEAWAAASIKEKENLDWETWAARANAYLQHVEFLFSPDLFILGGGVSNEQKRGEWMPFLNLNTKTVAAQFGNNAGILGAAMAAKAKKQWLKEKKKKKK